MYVTSKKYQEIIVTENSLQKLNNYEKYKPESKEN